MKSYPFIIFLLFILFTSCEFEINTDTGFISTDKLYEVSIYPDKTKNLLVANDFVRRNWNDVLSQEINFENNQELNIELSSEAKDWGVEGVINITTPGLKSTDLTEKVTEILKREMNVLHAEYKENKEFIADATKLSKDHTAMLEKQDYSSVGLLLTIGIEKLEDSIENPAKRIEEMHKEFNISTKKRAFIRRNLTELESPFEGVKTLQTLNKLFSDDNKELSEVLTYVHYQFKIYLVEYQIFEN